MVVVLAFRALLFKALSLTHLYLTNDATMRGDEIEGRL